ncbi:MAG TPA: phosphatidate cytidylyltransferase, partial [Ktedonobacterales bacterium]|nr:phosphatidate cytidylyltransferase [Ktedonobacterales bacterium]
MRRASSEISLTSGASKRKHGKRALPVNRSAAQPPSQPLPQSQPLSTPPTSPAADTPAAPGAPHNHPPAPGATAPHKPAPSASSNRHPSTASVSSFAQSAWEAIEALDHPSVSAPETDAETEAAKDPAAREAGWLAALWQRVVSAVVLIPIVLILALGGGWYAFAGGLAALALGAWELHSMFAHKGWRPQLLLSVGLGVVFLVAAKLPGQRLILIFVGISVAIIASFALFLLGRDDFAGAMRDWALTIAAPFYLGWPLALVVLLRGDAFGVGSRGFWWIIATCFMVWANDAAAYFVGHYFGRHKLSPYISPAKTWEGFAGGVVLAIIAAFIFTAPLHIAWYLALSLGALVAIVATIGDLAESLLKRGAGVKDSGTIIPGHGGILDRMDSLLFAVIVVFCFAAFIDKLL